jgi:hypothetical protein
MCLGVKPSKITLIFVTFAAVWLTECSVKGVQLFIFDKAQS